MGKPEIAMQLTLKAMDLNRLGLENEAHLENAKKVCEFYNEVYDNLREKFSRPIA